MFFRESLEKLRKKSPLVNLFFKIFDRKKSTLDKICENLPIGKVTLRDLIIGPDKKLGPNQIALREYIIDQTVNHGLLRTSVTFAKSADSLSLDDLAKDILAMYKAPEKGKCTPIFTELDLLK